MINLGRDHPRSEKTRANKLNLIRESLMQIDKERFLMMPNVFDKMAPYMVPQYNFLQDSIYEIIDYEKDKKFTFIDLGAGSGIQIEKILNRFPNSKAIYVDSSIPFTELAKSRLGHFRNRVQYIYKNLESDWVSEINDMPDLVFSMSTIHHLEPREKELLYKTVNEVLLPDGLIHHLEPRKKNYYTKQLMKFCYQMDGF